MDFGSVYHRASENYCYAFDKDNLMINIKTGYDVRKVYLHYGDPFLAGILGGTEKWVGKKKEIIQKKRLAYHQFWTINIEPEFKRCKYYFELETQTRVYFYFEDGFFTREEIENEEKILQYFIFPWMNPIDIGEIPKWVKDTIWYQIFPERFCNGNSERNPEKVKEWKTEKTAYNDYYGGDLEGIIQQLDYLKQLGINGIYLNPIFEANSNHKYDTKDYTKIDPHFGDKQVLKDLVNEAHKREIYIMLDGVFNHCGYWFMPWQDVLKKGQKSRYYNWFMIEQWPFDQKRKDTRDGKFYSFAFHAGMPKLNTNSPEVIDYFINICRDWINEYNIDGIRFDVGNEVSHFFLKQLRRELKRIKPEIYLLGEIWHDATTWLQGDEYDAVMNYPFMSSVNDFWKNKNSTKESFEYAINRCYTLYKKQNTEVLFNLLDSHDTDRLRNRVDNLDIFYQQLVVLFTMGGSPCIYYGTEIALEGGHDPDCRRCMPWKEIESSLYQEYINKIKQLIRIRTKEAACRSLNLEFISNLGGSRILSYYKTDDKKNRIQVILNCSEEHIKLRIQETDILFSNEWENGVLKKDGSLILNCLK